MLKINVVFPKQGETMVLEDPTAVVADRIIQWQFHSYRPDVEDVGIVFKDADANFFSVNGVLQNHCETNMRDRAIIWAKPHKQSPSNRRRKYSIIAWDIKGQKIQDLELDPTIIIDDP